MDLEYCPKYTELLQLKDTGKIGLGVYAVRDI